MSLLLLLRSLKTSRFNFKSLIFDEFDWLVNGLHVTTRCVVLRPTSSLTMYSKPNLVVGLQPRIAFAARHSLSRSPLVSRCLISNSTCSHAEHRSRPPSLSSGINDRASHAPSLPREYDAHGHELNPYRNGPSALEKAVHQFFFTEIIRGMCQLTDIQTNESFFTCLRNVDNT